MRLHPRCAAVLARRIIVVTPDCLFIDLQFSIEEIRYDFGLTGTACAGAAVPMLGYNRMVPGPLLDRLTCADCFPRQRCIHWAPMCQYSTPRSSPSCAAIHQYELSLDSWMSQTQLV
jgi:hypothetical protein